MSWEQLVIILFLMFFSTLIIYLPILVADKITKKIGVRFLISISVMLLETVSVLMLLMLRDKVYPVAYPYERIEGDGILFMFWVLLMSISLFSISTMSIVQFVTANKKSFLRKGKIS